mmetsp:Transcript_55885/g.141515  ORF Transcript_55885/g.141515 Transcript_55885/m.141515 type:complete len:235 (+) Transcript_55885:131-835(+)
MRQNCQWLMRGMLCLWPVRVHRHPPGSRPSSSCAPSARPESKRGNAHKPGSFGNPRLSKATRKVCTCPSRAKQILSTASPRAAGPRARSPRAAGHRMVGCRAMGCRAASLALWWGAEQTSGTSPRAWGRIGVLRWLLSTLPAPAWKRISWLPGAAALPKVTALCSMPSPRKAASSTGRTWFSGALCWHPLDMSDNAGTPSHSRNQPVCGTTRTACMRLFHAARIRQILAGAHHR